MEPTQIKQILLDYLQEVSSYESQKLVGKCLKRFEILEDRETLKKEIRELVYESFRDLKDIFDSYGKGIEVSYFKFIKKDKEK
jgi:hypothetical protein